MQKDYYFIPKHKKSKSTKLIYKKIYIIIIPLLIYIILFILLYSFYQKKKSFNKQKKFINFHLNSSKYVDEKLDFENGKFVILRDLDCATFCGLLSFYMHYLGCINNFLSSGQIPIVDLESFPNIFNGFNDSFDENPWEYFFEQPFGYKLNEIKKYAKHIEYVRLWNCYTFPIHIIYNQTCLLDFYHSISTKYLPIKNELINEANIIMNKLFKGSTNVLGIFTRGTDYMYRKPLGHPIPPSVEMLFQDIQEMDDKYNYDYYFLATEDEIIRTRLYNKFRKKMKFLTPKKDIHYNYTNPVSLNRNKNMIKNKDLNKVYVLSIFILSKCIDIISARTGGAVILFMFNEGFRNKKVYYLGSFHKENS